MKDIPALEVEAEEARVAYRDALDALVQAYRNYIFHPCWWVEDATEGIID